MAQGYDVALKLLFRSKSSQAVQEIAGRNCQLSGIPAVDLLGETIGGEFVHLEFISENQNLFELRMAGYYAEIYQAVGRHPRQALVYVGRKQLRMSGHFRSPTLNFRLAPLISRAATGTAPSLARLRMLVMSANRRF